MEDRLKLAFVSLLTAIGIPPILAGDGFADPQDRDIIHDDRTKQIDPIDYYLMADGGCARNGSGASRSFRRMRSWMRWSDPEAAGASLQAAKERNAMTALARV
jgi:hypothetical protein